MRWYSGGWFGMSEWVECKIKDVARRIRSGGTPSTKIKEYYGGEVPWLNTKEIGFNRITNTEGKITEDGLNNSSAKWIEPNSVVVAMYGATAGKIAINKIPLTTNQACCNLTIDEKIADYNFVYYYLYDSYTELENLASGAAQQNLNVGIISDFPIILPPLPEQLAIASVLSSLDDKIDLLHRQNKTLEAMAETLFRQGFVEEAEEGWEKKIITELFEIRDGTHDSPKQKEIGKPLLTSKHILKNRLDIENAYLISEDDFKNVNQRSKVDTNDILFSMIGTIGLIHLEQTSEINYAIKNIGLFKTSQNSDWAYYTYLWLKSSFGQDFIHEHRSGSTQEYISLGSLRSIVFSCPPIELHREFNEIVNSYFNKININNNQIRTLEKLRDTLLPKLMSGEVRVEL